jgi:hypothetical protein
MKQVYYIQIDSERQQKSRIHEEAIPQGSEILQGVCLGNGILSAYTFSSQLIKKEISPPWVLSLVTT